MQLYKGNDMNFKNTAYVRSLFTFIHTVGSKAYARRISKIESILLDEIDSFHLNVLKKELNKSIKKVPFYDKELYKGALSYGDLDSFLDNLPIIEKSDFINKDNRFFSKKWGKTKLKHNTSGSSGVPLTIYSSISEKLYAHAMVLNQIQKITGSWGMNDTLFLSGFYVNSDLNENNFYTRDKIFNNTYVSIYHFKADNADKYLKILSQYKPKIIFGYASAINELASIISDRKDFKHNIKMIISTSEILTDQYRENIEEVFKVNVTDMYGSQEGGHLVFQCEYGIKHINPSRGLIEIKNEKGVFRVGTGEAIITAIYRPSFPLYRYNIKDVVKVEKPKNICKCGLQTYIVKKIEGRSEDMVLTSDGRRIGYLNYHATKDLIGLKEGQLIQTNYEHFIFNCVFDDNVTESKRKDIIENIKDTLEERIGLRISVDFRDVESIEKTSKGKFKAVLVNDFPRNKEK